MEATKLGKKIKILRVEHSLEQGDLAEIFNFSGYQQISKWETGKLLPNIEQIAILSDRLKFNLFSILATMYEEKYNFSSVVPKKAVRKGQANLHASTFRSTASVDKLKAGGQASGKGKIPLKGNRSKE